MPTAWPGARPDFPHARQPSRARDRECGWPLSSRSASADHCTFLTDADVDALAAAVPSPSSAGTVATLLPGAEFGTRQPD